MPKPGPIRRRLLQRGEAYTADDPPEEMEGPPATPEGEVPEDEQVGDLEHEGGPSDGGN